MPSMHISGLLGSCKPILHFAEQNLLSFTWNDWVIETDDVKKQGANCEIQVLYHLKQETCWWIWNTLKHSPNFQCPSRLLLFLKSFWSSREWSFPALLESLFSFKLHMETLFFCSTWFCLKEVLAERRELFWEEQKSSSPPFHSCLFLRLKLSFSVL